MKAVTIDQVMEWNPCEEYSRERVTSLFTGRDTLSARDIAALEIAGEDRLWALLHPEFVSEEQAHLAACDFAESVVHLCSDDPRPRVAIEAKRAWLRGEIGDEELAAAWDAARAAAWDAARYAAWDAARYAARAAARAAAWAAAWYAAWDAARYAARAAARAAAWAAAWAAARAASWDAAWGDQLAILLRYIEGDNG